MDNVLVQGPQMRAVEIEDFNEYARISYTDENLLIDTILNASISVVECITNRKLIDQNWQLNLDHFEQEIVLPFSPVSAVNEITYYDTANTLMTLPAEEYDVNLASLKAKVRQAYQYTWPCTYPRYNAVTIDYNVGYADANSVDGDLKVAVLALALQMYEQRQTDIKLSFAKRILRSKRIISFV